MEVIVDPRHLLQLYKLPQKLKVTKGFYGKREDDSLGEGDVITAFYARKETTIVATTRAHRRVTIPENSPMHFWLLMPGPHHESDPVPDYSQTFTISEILRTKNFPVHVRAIDEGAELSASSAWSLTLESMEVQETLFAGNAQMGELMSLPLSLDVEFEIVFEEKAPPELRKTKSPYEYIADPFFESLLQANDVRGVGAVRLSHASIRKSKKKITLPRMESEYLQPVLNLFPEAEYMDPTPVRAESVSHKPTKLALKNMSVAEVCQMLVSMNLGQYVPAFEEQQIDGSLFTQLDDDMLGELKVTSKLHRLRLVNLIKENA